MKLIVLGGGGLQLKTIKLSKGMTFDAFLNLVPDGDDIITELMRQSDRIKWADLLGNLDWCRNKDFLEPIPWHLGSAI